MCVFRYVCIVMTNSTYLLFIALHSLCDCAHAIYSMEISEIVIYGLNVILVADITKSANSMGWLRFSFVNSNNTHAYTHPQIRMHTHSMKSNVILWFCDSLHISNVFWASNSSHNISVKCWLKRFRINWSNHFHPLLFLQPNSKMFHF